MRHRLTGMAHGIVRKSWTGQGLQECTFWFGRKHGLSISYLEGEVLAVLFQNGKHIASLRFDRNFSQLARKGEALNYLSVSDFNPNVDKFAEDVPTSKY